MYKIQVRIGDETQNNSEIGVHTSQSRYLIHFFLLNHKLLLIFFFYIYLSLLNRRQDLLDSPTRLTRLTDKTITRLTNKTITKLADKTITRLADKTIARLDYE